MCVPVVAGPPRSVRIARVLKLAHELGRRIGSCTRNAISRSVQEEGTLVRRSAYCVREDDSQRAHAPIGTRDLGRQQHRVAADVRGRRTDALLGCHPVAPRRRHRARAHAVVLVVAPRAARPAVAVPARTVGLARCGVASRRPPGPGPTRVDARTEPGDGWTTATRDVLRATQLKLLKR